LTGKLKLASQMIEWRELAVRLQQCSLCHFFLLVRFGNREHSVRCLRCGANPAAMAMAEALRNRVSDLQTCKIYELSSRGPFFRFLQKQSQGMVFSEFFDDVPSGDSRHGVLCQDVQDLTFPDHSFDLCTSMDVLEHVPDDLKAFAELHRVLKPGGLIVFTVPLNIERRTVERAILTGQGIKHLLEPQFHNDHIRGSGQVLCFRNYGSDIIERLKSQGFSTAEILTPDSSRWWNHDRHVVLARR
jgi:SAM-dependent methyltransferase